jgi:hypothetical protein
MYIYMHKHMYMDILIRIYVYFITDFKENVTIHMIW